MTSAGTAPGGVRVTATELSRVANGQRILSSVSLSVSPGELVAVVGGSGAGKTTLLETLAGVVPPDEGRVTHDGVSVYDNLQWVRARVGFVPQDDIIHTELPLEHTLRYAAALRLPSDTEDHVVDSAVRRSLEALGLAGRRGTIVGSLSGGQRKRASVAVELLARPGAFFLDEPTSGLDPATAANLLSTLRGLAGSGITVMFTTHSPQDLERCDRVVFLGPGGILAFVGDVPSALRHFDVDDVTAVYEHLEIASPIASGAASDELISDSVAGPKRPGPLHQLRTLTARTVETMIRNKLTLAILLGSPAMVVALFVILFRPGVFAPATLEPTAIAMIIFWVVFGAFFFGLTYGLLQIVVERPILRREYLAGLRLGPYLMSKIVVMAPFLAVVNVMMLVVLRLFDRLPAGDLATYASIWVTLLLTSLAALTLGLLASAAVNNASQATLTLPMLCFPAVLFSGAIVPVNIMAVAGRWIAAAVPTRYAFEAVGHDLGLRRLMSEGGSALGPPLLETYGDAGLMSTGTYWLILAVFTLLFLGAAALTLARNAARDPRLSR